MLMGTSRYREWNPILISAEGGFERGGTIRYQMKAGDGTTTLVEPLVRRLEAEREINQLGGMCGVLSWNKWRRSSGWLVVPWVSAACHSGAS